ncbi:unnamed protein product, partial [Tetraodon nigroviridis]
LRRVDPRFLSVTIDASLAADERFMYLLSSPKVRTLAKALTPAFLRFGGTRQDFMVFAPHKNQPASGFSARELTFSSNGQHSCEKMAPPPWLERRLRTEWMKQQVMLRNEELQRKYRRVKFTETTVDQLHAFANCSGLDLVFGLNALLRTADNRWNSSNARSLLRYCEARRYHMSWELGNEPNSYEKKAGLRLDGRQLGEDFTVLRKILRESRFYRDAGLFGPDVGQPRDHRIDILSGFLQSGAEAVDACTWHHYYLDGREASLEDFLDPDVLDTLREKIGEVLEEVHQVSPGKPVWLGETSSAYGGGAAGLSDTFVAGFMWLDKLGLAATLGLELVMRQVLIGAGSYHLMDDNLDPLPRSGLLLQDYWLSLLYKRLVGQEVLKTRHTPGPAGSERVRLYLHCANKQRCSLLQFLSVRKQRKEARFSLVSLCSYRSGAATLMSMNLSKQPARISLPRILSSSTVEAFVLESEQPGEEGLRSRAVKLNGRVLRMVDDETFPELEGSRLPAAEHLQLPAYSLAFFVFTDAQAAGCV